MEEHSFGSVFRSNPRPSLSNPPFERRSVGSAIPSPRTLPGSFFSLLNRTRHGSVRELRRENIVLGRWGEEEVNSIHLTKQLGQIARERSADGASGFDARSFLRRCVFGGLEEAGRRTRP